MVYVLIAIFLLGVFASKNGGLFGRKRTITPQAVPEAEAQPQRRIPVPKSARVEPPEPEDVAPEPPIASATPAGRPAYLLTGPLARGAPDRSAAMMAMMAGPGICTPRDS